MVPKILIVDDEPDLAALITFKFRKQIKEEQLRFVFANNGVEALEKFKQDPDIDIVLTDINMPEMDGLSLLNNLNQCQKLFKAVVVSAYGDMSNIRAAMNLGASDFVTKPIDFQDLEITITKTISQLNALKDAIDAKRRLGDVEKELNIAKIIQQSFLPRNYGKTAGSPYIDWRGIMIAAKHIGGDFFDYFPIDEMKWAFVAADVSGKGIPAALFMTVCRTLIRSTVTQHISLADALARVNYLLGQGNDSCMFVTVFIGILDLEKGLMHYCNAGHNPPYIVSADGTLTKFPWSQGMGLGVFESEAIEPEKTIEFKTDDTLVLYTDGITEAMNSHEELYGDSRFEASLKKTVGQPIQQKVESILADVKAFVQDASQSDDITLFLVRYMGKDVAPSVDGEPKSQTNAAVSINLPK